MHTGIARRTISRVIGGFKACFRRVRSGNNQVEQLELGAVPVASHPELGSTLVNTDQAGEPAAA